jgi:hypothetical protein
MTEFWITFWGSCLVLAAITFTLITAAIAWNGVKELFELVRDLGKHSDDQTPDNTSC